MNQNIKDMSNTSSGYWSVLTYAGSRKNKSGSSAYWMCRCRCGHTREVKGESLRRGNSKGCGSCTRYLKPYETLYRRLVKHAGERSIPCTLTYEAFVSLAQHRACHYCGQDLTWAEHTPEKMENGFRTNLDRKDNAEGYHFPNLVACCWPCNNTKSDMLTYEEMLAVGKIRRNNRQLVPPTS